MVLVIVSSCSEMPLVAVSVPLPTIAPLISVTVAVNSWIPEPDEREPQATATCSPARSGSLR